MSRVVLLRRWRGSSSWAQKAVTLAGHEFSTAQDSELDPRSADIVWAQGNINWFPRARARLASLDPCDRPGVIVWHSEPLPFPKDSGFGNPHLTLREFAKIALRDSRATDAYTNFLRLKQMYSRRVIDRIVVTSRSRQTFLAEKGIPSQFIPLGYHQGIGRKLDVPRDIDVLFLGTLDDSRHRRAIRFLRSRGVRIEATGSWTSRDTWGEGRTRLINRARIFLNIQRHPGQYSGYRMLLGMGNAAMVLSEPVCDPFPYEPGVHYVSSQLQSMPETIAKYLSDDAARTAIAEAGHRFATESLTMEDSMREMIAAIDGVLGERQGK